MCVIVALDIFAVLVSVSLRCVCVVMLLVAPLICCTSSSHNVSATWVLSYWETGEDSFGCVYAVHRGNNILFMTYFDEMSTGSFLPTNILNDEGYRSISMNSSYGFNVVVKFTLDDDTLHINGKRYNLEKGRLFLLKVRSAGVTVKQVVADVSNISERNKTYVSRDIKYDGIQAYLIEYAEENTEIREFIRNE